MKEAFLLVCLKFSLTGGVITIHTLGVRQETSHLSTRNIYLKDISSGSDFKNAH